MLLTTLVHKHQAGNAAQPEKPPMFEQADVEMCAHSRAASVSISDVKERVYLFSGKRGRGKTAAASLSIAFRGKPGVSDSRWTG